MIRACRVVAVGLGVAILGWQIRNAWRGAFLHTFLLPDLIAATLLVHAGLTTDPRRARRRLRVGFAATMLVFAVATTSVLFAEGFTVGRALTAVGLIPCAACLALMSRSGTVEV